MPYSFASFNLPADIGMGPRARLVLLEVLCQISRISVGTCTNMNHMNDHGQYHRLWRINGNGHQWTKCAISSIKTSRSRRAPPTNTKPSRSNSSRLLHHSIVPRDSSHIRSSGQNFVQPNDPRFDRFANAISFLSTFEILRYVVETR